MIEGEEKAGGGRRSSEEQEEQRKMGGEGEELHGGGWQRGWVRISLHRASWQGSGVMRLLALHSRCGQRPCSPRQLGMRAGWWGSPGNSAERAVERPGPPAQALPCPCHWRSPKNRARPAIGVGHLLLVNDMKLAVFRVMCGHKHTALLLCCPPTPQCGWLLASPRWGLLVPGSAPLAASSPSLAWRRCGCKQPGCSQGCSVNRRICLVTSEQGGESSNAERETGRWGGWDMGNTHRVRYPPGEQGGGCSRAGCYTPHQQHLFLHEMPVPQRLRQHPRAHACCLPGLLSRTLAKGWVCWGRAGTSLGPRGCPGSWLSPRAVPSASLESQAATSLPAHRCHLLGPGHLWRSREGTPAGGMMGQCLGMGH